MYSFQCVECGASEALEHDFVAIGCYIPQPCSMCGGRIRRAASFSFHRPMPDHYNPSVGKYVSGERQYRDELKRASENASIRTGIDHNFQPVDMNDTKSLGVTEEGLYESNKRKRDSGLVDAKGKIIT